jgi:RNA polymerase sigma factor (sigma-70 family)
MLRPQEIAANHVDLFIERYERLFLWSLQLTENDQSEAEDLLHDCFIQFTLGQPDLNSIQNLEGYLRTMLRNIHVSQVRRSARSPIRSLSIVEYDSAELGLRVIDPRTQLNVQDELRTVCEYASARKDSSKAGSILILRFFHGYYPDEISKVAQISRPAVKERLRLARAEAKLYLDSPKALGFMQQTKETKTNQAVVRSGQQDFLTELRQTIFSTRRGECLTREALHEMYSGEDASVDCETLAHTTSCPQCLDAANALLGLPLLSERHAAETVGKDTPRKKGGSGGGGGGGPRGGSAMSSVSEYMRRAKEVFEHEPQELFISVNGYVLGSQKISSELMEQTLSLKGEENIGFVEVFSEQEIRLLLLNVEPLPDGPVKQSARVKLGEGRTLDVNLSFSGAWPTLHVVYRDPSLVEQQQEAQEEIVGDAVPSSTNAARTKRQTIGNTLKQALTRLGRALSSWNVWSRPSAVTAIFALILIAALFLVQFRKPASIILAADLLNRSAAMEEMNEARTDQVLHRTISLEERNSAGQLVSSRKIEEWHSGENGITARRLYNEKGALIAGDWRRRDGAQTLYSHGQNPRLRLAPEKRAGLSLAFADVWQLEPSATEFTQLIKDSEKVKVEELASTYSLSYSSDGAEGLKGLIKATLVLSRSDLHAIEETLLLRQGEETREYRFTESSFERHSPSTVAPAVFEPEKELLSSVKPETGNSKLETTPLPVSSSPTAPSPSAATAAQEVEVLQALNSVGADMGEQVNVTRSPDGLLRVQGIVETEQRKQEILKALHPVSNNPAVRVDIKTVAEALKQSKSQNSDSAETLERVTGASNSFPIQEDLRRYFSGKGVPENQLDERSTQFAYRMAGESSQVLQHAWALRRLAERFSPEELRTLDPEARTKWLGLIHQHARGLRHSLATLREGLGPLFPSAAAASGLQSQGEIKDDGELQRAIGRLFELCSHSDEEIRSALSVSTDPTKGRSVRTRQFWLSFKAAEDLAKRIASD